MGYSDEQVLVKRVKAPANAITPLEFWTFGRKRFELLAGEPAVEFTAIVNVPAAPLGVGKGTYFFRDNGAGKAQFCVRFPSGAVQILATEP